MPRITRNLLFYLMFTSVGLVLAEEKGGIDLSPNLKGKKWTAQVSLKVSGELKFNQGGKKVTREKLSVDGQVIYRERVEEVPSSGRLFSKSNQTAAPKVVAARRYKSVKSVLKVNDNETVQRLPSRLQDVRVTVSPKDMVLTSPKQNMMWSNVDLLDLQANSLVIHELLPEKPVKIGASWEPAPNVLAQVFRIDAIAKSTVKVKLTKANSRSAELQLSGKVSGAVQGVATEIDATGRAIVDRRLHAITQLVLNFQENRAIGHASPGLEVKCKLQLRLDPDHTKPLMIADSAAGDELIRFRSVNHFQLLHGRKWRTVADFGGTTVFRMIERGDLVAQCNVRTLRDLKPGTFMPLAEFQDQVKRSLGDRFGKFVSAAETTNDNSLKVKKLVVSGEASKLPVTWVYYLIAAGDGRQNSMVFTLESRLLERFGAEDESILSSFELLKRTAPETAKSDSSEKSR